MGLVLRCLALAGSEILLLALDFHLGPVQEFAIVGDPIGEETQRVLRLLRQGFRPSAVFAFKSSDSPSAIEQTIPLLAGKTSQGPVTLYVCQNFACQTPLIGATAVEAALPVSLGNST